MVGTVASRVATVFSQVKVWDQQWSQVKVFTVKDGSLQYSRDSPDFGQSLGSDIGCRTAPPPICIGRSGTQRNPGWTLSSSIADVRLFTYGRDMQGRLSSSEEAKSLYEGQLSAECLASPRSSTFLLRCADAGSLDQVVRSSPSSSTGSCEQRQPVAPCRWSCGCRDPASASRYLVIRARKLRRSRSRRRISSRLVPADHAVSPGKPSCLVRRRFPIVSSASLTGT